MQPWNCTSLPLPQPQAKLDSVGRADYVSQRSQETSASISSAAPQRVNRQLTQARKDRAPSASAPDSPLRPTAHSLSRPSPRRATRTSHTPGTPRWWPRGRSASAGDGPARSPNGEGPFRRPSLGNQAGWRGNPELRGSAARRKTKKE